MQRFGLLLCCFFYACNAGAGENPDREFCAWAQGVIAETSLEPAVTTHSTWEAFVESKPSDQPFRVEQYLSSHLPGERPVNTVISCKMRTAERINSAHQLEGSDSPPAGAESSCDAIHRAMLAQVYREVAADERAIERGQWLVAEEDLTFIGPNWVEPWPFVPLTTLADGQYQLNSRALYVPYSRWIPMPDRFLGNYYCHLVAPSYLESLVRGNMKAPTN